VNTERRLRVAEVFGPTIQGEGEMQGTVTHFIRFGGCDYRCSWCDSPHAVLPRLVKELPFISRHELIQKVVALPWAPWITLSGGNPAAQHLEDVVFELQQRGYLINIETQGTVARNWIKELDNITISPKPPSSGNVTKPEVTERFLEKAELWSVQEKVSLKVVVFDDTDFEYAVDMHERFPEFSFWTQVGNPDPGPTVGNDAQGSTDDPAPVSELLDRLHWLSEKVLAEPRMADVRVNPQMHVLIWGNQRGR
jgi:7-carboxy-7-deazaguanine synthase